MYGTGPYYALKRKLRLKSKLRTFNRRFHSVLTSPYKWVNKVIFKRFRAVISILLSRALDGSSNAVKLVNLVSLFGVNEGDLWKSIQSLIVKRSLSFDSLITNLSEIKSTEIRELVMLQDAFRSSSAPTVDWVQGRCEYYKRGRVTGSNRSAYRSILVSLIIQHFKASLAIELIKGVELTFSQLSSLQQLKILKKAAEQGDESLFEDLSEEVQGTLNSIACVKVQTWQTKLRPMTHSFSELESAFISAGGNLPSAYAEHLRPLYHKLPPDVNWLDSSINPDTNSLIKESLLSALTAKKKYAYVRLCDGEGYGFPNINKYGGFDFRRQELHWWGKELERTKRSEIQARFQSSLEEFDIVGLPSVIRLIEEAPVNKDVDWRGNALINRLFTVVEGYLTQRPSGQKVVECQSNLSLINIRFLEQLNDCAEKIIVVSGLDASYLAHLFPCPERVEYIELPTHRLLRNREHASKGHNAVLPDVYEEILRQIECRAFPGVAFLFSAGFVGKIFSAEAARNGAVSIDAGQILEKLAANSCGK